MKQGPDLFATTRWSLVLAARKRETPAARAALATLCETYWYPLYAYARRRGRSREEAEDLTQEFFSRFLEKQFLKTIDRDRGKFRAFIITVFKRFLSDEGDRAHALKRGGGRVILPFDIGQGEERYALEPKHDWTAERLFERRWALILLDRVLERLENQFRNRGKGELFEELKGYLTGEPKDETQSEHARRLGLGASALKVAIHRLRKNYQDLVREELSQTVASAEDVDEELEALIAVLSEKSAPS